MLGSSSTAPTGNTAAATTQAAGKAATTLILRLEPTYAGTSEVDFNCGAGTTAAACTTSNLQGLEADLPDVDYAAAVIVTNATKDPSLARRWYDGGRGSCTTRTLFATYQG